MRYSSLPPFPGAHPTRELGSPGKIGVKGVDTLLRAPRRGRDSGLQDISSLYTSLLPPSFRIREGRPGRRFAPSRYPRLRGDTGPRPGRSSPTVDPVLPVIASADSNTTVSTRTKRKERDGGGEGPLSVRVVFYLGFCRWTCPGSEGLSSPSLPPRRTLGGW